MARKRTAQEIDAEIARLQQERDKARDAEKADVVGRMKGAIAYYGITASDLGFGSTARKTRGPAAKGKTVPGRVKFKDDASHTWSGFGPKPKWFTDALASGKTADDLRAA